MERSERINGIQKFNSVQIKKTKQQSKNTRNLFRFSNSQNFIK
jgi:hypothetical protein